VDGQVAAFQIEQAARAAEIVQQMTVDVKQIGVVADATDDVLVPDLGQQGSAGGLHCRILPFFLLPWQIDAPPPAVLHGRHSGPRPNPLAIIKTYWSRWANV
jgi:hypothetical protein